MNLTTAELATIVGGRVLARGRPITGVSTDTRTLQEGDAFFALLPREDEGGADGHAHIADAATRGAAAAVTCRALRETPEGLGVVEVADSLIALGRLGAYWRARMPARVVAVTGSVGKTSTKAMIGSILCSVASTVVSERSYNNEIGVPLTLLGLGREHRFCVLEFAMRGPGEIEYLARIARPEVGVITNIGVSHIGRLGSLDAIAAAKGEVLPLLPATGAAVLNRDDAFFAVLCERTMARVVSFGWGAEADAMAQDVEDRGLNGTSFVCCVGDEKAQVSLRVPGRHFVANALAAAGAAYALGVDMQPLARGLSAYEGTEMRGRVIRSPEGFAVIADCYNAAPASVEAALRLLASATGRKVFVFGDMAELGEMGPEAHRQVGRLASELGVTLLVAVGELARLAGDVARPRGVEAVGVGEAPEATDVLKQRLQPGDTVLVKGSRVMHLEDVVEGLVGDA